MTSLFENLSTRLPSPLANTCTAPLLLGFAVLHDGLDKPHGILGAKVDVNAAILSHLA